MTAPSPLPVDALKAVCDESRLGFETTAELADLDGVLGQARALRALHFGTRIASEGYNIYALGTSGTGKFSTVRHILQAEAQKRSLLPDCTTSNSRTSPTH